MWYLISVLFQYLFSFKNKFGSIAKNCLSNCYWNCSSIKLDEIINMVQKVSLTLQHLVRNLRVLFTPVNSHLIIRIFFATLKILANYCLRRFKIVEWVKKEWIQAQKVLGFLRGAQKLMGENLKLVWAEFSTIS
jgi:hypothetical protein